MFSVSIKYIEWKYFFVRIFCNEQLIVVAYDRMNDYLIVHLKLSA